MVNVDIDDGLYEDIKRIVKKDKIKHPSIKHFVQVILFDRVTEIKRERIFKKTKSKFKKK